MTDQNIQASRSEKFGLVFFLSLTGITAEVLSIIYLVKFIKQENIGSRIRNIFDQIPKNIFDMPGFREKLLNYSGLSSLGYEVLRRHARGHGYRYIKVDDHPFATLKPNSLEDILKGELNGFGYTNSSEKYIKYFSNSSEYALLLDTNQCAKEYLEELIKKSPELKTPEIENFLRAVEKQKELYALRKASCLPLAFCLIGITLSSTIIIIALIMTFCISRPNKEIEGIKPPITNEPIVVG